MAKGDAYYLRHDNDAFSDPKIIKLRMLHGFEAYALYWRILEMMFDEPDNTLAYNEAIFEVISFDTRTTLDVSEVIDTGIDIGLFQVQDGYFYSPSLLRRMESVKVFSQKKSEQAKRAAEARWAKNKSKDHANADNNNAGAMRSHSVSNADAMQNDAMRREEKRREEKIREDTLPSDHQEQAPDNSIADVIEYLNEQTGSRYRVSTESTRRLIKARMREGFTLDDFKVVISKKAKEWKGGEMEKYLRPETLFGTKFESYLNQEIRPPTANSKYAPRALPSEYEDDPEDMTNWLG